MFGTKALGPGYVCDNDIRWNVVPNLSQKTPQYYWEKYGAQIQSITKILLLASKTYGPIRKKHER